MGQMMITIGVICGALSLWLIPHGFHILSRNKHNKGEVIIEQENKQDSKLVQELPDGRAKIGSIITGRPATLLNEYQKAVKDYDAQEYRSALLNVQNAIRAYEDSKKIEDDLRATNEFMIDEYLSKEQLSQIYELGSIVAQRLGRDNLAKEYKEKSDTILKKAK